MTTTFTLEPIWDLSHWNTRDLEEHLTFYQNQVRWDSPIWQVRVDEITAELKTRYARG